MTDHRGILGGLPPGDYVSPDMRRVRLDAAFPHMVAGNTAACSWAYLRREVPHTWYVDARYPRCGFLNRDEAHILYNNALAFHGRRALEVGCWKGWSTCHLLAAGVCLDVIDPVLGKPEFLDDVSAAAAAVSQQLGLDAAPMLWAEASPEAIERLAAERGRRWSLIFIDGSHEAPAPLRDVMYAEQHAEQDALVLLHDLACPDVASGLEYLRAVGWQVGVYQTAQIMGAAWRGRARATRHLPDPTVQWTTPEHLREFPLIESPSRAPQATI